MFSKKIFSNTKWITVFIILNVALTASGLHTKSKNKECGLLPECNLVLSSIEHLRNRSNVEIYSINCFINSLSITFNNKSINWLNQSKCVLNLQESVSLNLQIKNDIISSMSEFETTLKYLNRSKMSYDVIFYFIKGFFIIPPQFQNSSESIAHDFPNLKSITNSFSKRSNSAK